MELTKPHSLSSESPAPIDPEHEIDAKKTVLWLSAALVFVVCTLWVLGLVFNFSVQGARYQKIDLAPTTELQRTRLGADLWLKQPGLSWEAWNEAMRSAAEQAPEQTSITDIEASIRRSTDQAIRNYVK
jgi:hypothetical protein